MQKNRRFPSSSSSSSSSSDGGKLNFRLVTHSAQVAHLLTYDRNLFSSSRDLAVEQVRSTVTEMQKIVVRRRPQFNFELRAPIE
jgi:hypothetical protein